MLLLDASVWIAAVDSEDRYHDPARALVIGRVGPLGALDLTLYEVANVLGAVKGRRDLAARLCEALIVRSRGNLVRIDRPLVERAMALAERRPLTAYDAAYVVAAQERAWTLVSGDLRGLVEPGHAVAPDAPALGAAGS